MPVSAIAESLLHKTTDTWSHFRKGKLARWNLKEKEIERKRLRTPFLISLNLSALFPVVVMMVVIVVVPVTVAATSEKGEEKKRNAQKQDQQQQQLQ